MPKAPPIRVVRTGHRLLPDPRRVVARPNPAASREPLADGRSPAKDLLRRLLAIPEAAVPSLLDEVHDRFAGRHRNLEAILEHNFQLAAPDLPPDAKLSHERRLLIGAYFTMEHALESAALFNPSIVAAPDQSGVPAGAVRFILSLRAVGEGHLSSIEFRSGMIDAEGAITIDPPSTWARTGYRTSPLFSKSHVRARAVELGADPALCARLLDPLPERFHAGDLDAAAARLDAERALTFETVRLVRLVTASNYEVSFPSSAILSERVLVPAGPRETQGMEDARFVRFVGDDGKATYYATYTAFDGFGILPQLIETPDFVRFRVGTLSGRCARNKGMALFPRLIGGRYAMLARHDHQNLHLLYSDDVRSWNETRMLLRPGRPWSIVHVGNCGSPIETPEGWLVLTHGVGAFRRYSIGAILLDLEDPGRVIGELPEPLLEPDETEREGYVPNVVYSCGSMVHGRRLVLPYGFADRGSRIALVDLEDLLARLLDAEPARPAATDTMAPDADRRQDAARRGDRRPSR